MSEASWLEEIDHTGDIGIRVQAPDLRTLFERAAVGMFRVIADLEAVLPTTSVEIKVEADDRDELLVRWLSELNFLHLTEQMLYCRFEIREMTERRLAASASGEAIDRTRHVVHTEVKAVTYHGLEIRHTKGQWTAQVIFDM